jgi:hypothetical protein
MFGGSMSMTEYYGSPNKMANIIKVEAGGQTMILQKSWFDGESGGEYAAMKGKTAYAGDTLERKKRPSFPLEQYWYMQDPTLKVELLGIDEVDGEEYYKIKIQREGEDEFSFEYYSVKSGWLEIQESFGQDPEGNTIVTTVKFSDYQEVKKGFMAPNKITIIQPAFTIETELKKAKIKKKAKSKAFGGQF